MSTYRLPSPYAQSPLRRRASGFALALAINAALLLVLLGMGIVELPVRKPSDATIVDMIPQSHSRAAAPAPSAAAASRPVPKPPPIVLPVKPTIVPPPPVPHPKAQPWVEMSSDQMAAADLRNLPSGGPSAGDSEEVGRGPHGEILYAAEWAREPTHAELEGYLPKDAPDGWGMVACKTIPGNRVENCQELGQSPAGSHLARALRLAAWQFRVRPPRRGGKLLIGEWVQIRLIYGNGA